MTLILSILAGAVFAVSAYLLMRWELLEAILGFSLLTNAANLAILAGSGYSPQAAPPILGDDYRETLSAGGKAAVSAVDSTAYADPIPQALILTAIVIGFALASFAMVMASELAEREAQEEKAGRAMAAGGEGSA